METTENLAVNYRRKGNPTYETWSGMKQRCLNPKATNFCRYGGKGVKICARWLTSFKNFVADMGPRPPGMTIDRYPNKNGNYEPGNCRWATPYEQQNNRRSNLLLKFNGVVLNATQWAIKLKLHRNTIYSRAKKGLSASRILLPAKATEYCCRICKHSWRSLFSTKPIGPNHCPKCSSLKWRTGKN